MTVKTDAVRSGVDREKRITEMKLERIRDKIEEMEKNYEMTSERFREKFNSGELDDREDFVKWDVYLDIVKELEEKKEELSRFKE